MTRPHGLSFLVDCRTKHTKLSWGWGDILDLQISLNRVSEDQLNQDPICAGDVMSSYGRTLRAALAIEKREDPVMLYCLGSISRKIFGISRGHSSNVAS